MTEVREHVYESPLLLAHVAFLIMSQELEDVVTGKRCLIASPSPLAVIGRSEKLEAII